MKDTKEFPELFFYAEPVDMRKQIVSLASFVETSLNKDPFDKNLYVFVNKKRDLLKAVYWDETGFALWSKRLDQSKFPWPSKDSERIWTLTPNEFRQFLQGIDFFKRHQSLDYKSLT